MRILIAVSYYWPYVSGLNLYVKRLAEGLAREGHNVTIITSQYDKSLPSHETLNGVDVVRVPIQFWISKGAIMLGYVKWLIPLVRKHDVILLNLPNTFIETFAISIISRIVKRPVLAIYHCDIYLSKGFFHNLINAVVHWVNRVGAAYSDGLITNSMDFAKSSPVLRHYLHKVTVIPPPIEIQTPDPIEVERFKNKYSPNREKLIGFCGRVSAEKGLHHLISALPFVQVQYPDARLLFAGNFKHVIGEQDYFEMLKPMITAQETSIVLLGYLPEELLPAFFSACDVFVLPSVNNTESFGQVQVESMLCGTPVIGSNLPGVRVPVLETGMGMIVDPGRPEELGRAVIQVLQNRELFIKPHDEIDARFSTKGTVRAYLQAISHIIKICTDELET